MSDRTWRVFHADGPAPDPDVTAVLGRSGIWSRIGPDLWLCPGGVVEHTWAEMSPEWGPYVECPNYQQAVENWEHAGVPGWRLKQS